ncbi:glycosyl hydrolase [Flavobacterium sp.]|uniref:glycosyl hydrolase n=1 Tax=Flavobacterium sp. TaxID=239 RepID=UPI00286A8E3A|nr:glycosyl hydrolase [Flavobacterium sp.]
MNKTAYFGTLLFLLLGQFANAQDIVWTGSASNNDFFDEGNWKNSVTNAVPTSGAIDPATAINLPLKINTVATTITANGEINLGTGTLDVTTATLSGQSLSGAGGTLTVNQGGYIELSDATPFKTTTPKVQINFTSGIGWVKTLNTSARIISLSNLGQIKVNGIASSYTSNLRLDNYYLKGCVIRSNEATTSPLTVYDSGNLQGNSGLITVNTIHSGDAITSTMNNKIESFILKKGFMATFADEANGTGSSKNYIASESDLVINVFPKLLQNSISFIRVLPWNWVTKKGRNNTGIDLNTSWRYQWNHTESSSVNWEFAPMSWGHGTTTDGAIAGFVAKYGSPYIMSFNEPDDCDAQSGQYGFVGSPKLCVIDEAVKLHKSFMKTGMRIVSPGGREEAPFGWLEEFYNKAKAQDIRIDVIAVHWYDWGSNPVANPNPTALQVFNRFKAYLTNVHNKYGLPIWITEFNANPARSQAINAGFLALAMPYLESLEYIERYCWFPYNTGTHFYTTLDAAATTLSQVGTIYKNINNTTPVASTPSIPEATVDANNNLNLLTYPNIALNKPATANSSYSPSYLPSNAVDGDITTASSQWFVNFGVSGDVNYTPLPAWIEIDLQGSYTVDSFRIIEFSKALKDFRFEVWDATLNSGAGGWASALTVTGNPASPLTTFKSISPVTTTKVRLYITAHNSTGYMRMFELEVYGKAIQTLDVKQYEKQGFKVYPNPVSNGILNINGNQEVQTVEVYSILGAQINTPFENGQLLVNDLAPGIYFLRINKSYSVKFIKK